MAFCVAEDDDAVEGGFLAIWSWGGFRGEFGPDGCGGGEWAEECVGVGGWPMNDAGRGLVLAFSVVGEVF